MISAFIRLFALRPFLTMAILGIPVILLIAVGLFTILAFKFLVFIVLPIAVVVWLFRRITRSGDSTTT
jgi:type IV secretory pathway VirB3-like protein